MARKPQPQIDNTPLPSAPAAPAKPKMRLLLNPANGRILPWSERLAERADLVECNEAGIPLRPMARRLAQKAELEAQQREAAQQAFGGQTLVTETKDSFGAPSNPTAALDADNTDLGEPEAE